MNKSVRFQRQASHVIQNADALAVRRGLECLFAQEPLNYINSEARSTAEIILAEALNNIVEHAYSDAPGKIEINVDLSMDGLECTIADHGAPMPDDQLPAGKAYDLDQMEELPEGGFGWFLIRTLALDLQYSRCRGQNYLRFRVPVTARVA